MNTISFETERLLTLSQLSGVGPAALRKVLSLPQHSRLTYEEIAGRIPSVAKAISEQSALPRAIESAGKQIEEAKRFGARIISVCDPDYPELLSRTKDDPILLYLRGSLASAPSQSVAIIGTREPTPHGELIANRITEFFVEKGWSIVSGLAIGCDAIAHETAVLAGGHTVAVLAHGLQMIAPARHRKLADRILAAGGALLSEYPFGREIQKAQYVKRDRTQAGLARGVVMIQSDTVGGSLHASRAALSYGRWLAVPYPTDRDREAKEPKTQANLLIAEGAEEDRCALLHCSSRDLKNVIILKSREQYPQLLGELDDMTHLRSEYVGRSTNTSTQQDELQGVSSTLTPISDSAQQVSITENVVDVDVEEKKSESATRKVAEHDADTHGWLSTLPFALGDNTSTKLPPAPKLLLAPSIDDSRPEWLAFSLENPSIASALFARLSHVKSCLDVVDATYRNKTDAKGLNYLQLLTLVIDDLLAQMEHAVELLDAIANVLGNESREQDTLLREHRAPIDAKDHAEPEETNALELLSGLKNLRLASSHRLILASYTSANAQQENIVNGEKNASTTEADLRLPETIEKFNEIVRQVLYQESATQR